MAVYVKAKNGLWYKNLIIYTKDWFVSYGQDSAFPEFIGIPDSFIYACKIAENIGFILKPQSSLVPAFRLFPPYFLEPVQACSVSLMPIFNPDVLNPCYHLMFDEIVRRDPPKWAKIYNCTK